MNIKQRFQYLLLIFTLLCFFNIRTLASPTPGMGSSVLLSPSKGYMFNVRGFSLNRATTQWLLQSQDSLENKETHEISVRYQEPNQSGFLSVRTESLPVPMHIDFYAKKWLRDYSLYGFDILGAKSFSQNNARGYVIDLYHRKKNKQLRQVVFLKDRTSVILTCSDDKAKFKETLNSCNSILKTFSWL